MDKSSTYPHFHISTATICRFVRTYITIFTNKIAQSQHMGEFTPQQLAKSQTKNPNPLPIGTRFGFLLFGADDRT